MSEFSNGRIQKTILHTHHIEILQIRKIKVASPSLFRHMQISFMVGVGVLEQPIIELW